MKRLLILSALILSACTQSLTTPSPAATAPTISVASDPIPLPMPAAEPAAPGDPYVADRACHAILYPQADYGQPDITIVQFGPDCPAGQRVQLGLFPDGLHYVSPPMPANGVDVLRADAQVIVRGTYGASGYEVATRLVQPDGGASDWYQSSPAFVPPYTPAR